MVHGTLQITKYTLRYTRNVSFPGCSGLMKIPCGHQCSLQSLHNALDPVFCLLLLAWLQFSKVLCMAYHILQRIKQTLRALLGGDHLGIGRFPYALYLTQGILQVT